jgi:hypothetical protein
MSVESSREMSVESSREMSIESSREMSIESSRKIGVESSCEISVESKFEWSVESSREMSVYLGSISVVSYYDVQTRPSRTDNSFFSIFKLRFFSSAPLYRLIQCKHCAVNGSLGTAKRVRLRQASVYGTTGTRMLAVQGFLENPFDF